MTNEINIDILETFIHYCSAAKSKLSSDELLLKYYQSNDILVRNTRLFGFPVFDIMDASSIEGGEPIRNEIISKLEALGFVYNNIGGDDFYYLQKLN